MQQPIEGNTTPFFTPCTGARRLRLKLSGTLSIVSALALISLAGIQEPTVAAPIYEQDAAKPAADAPPHKGFFGDYTMLQPARAPDGAPVLRWRSPTFTPANYQKILIDPIYTLEPTKNNEIQPANMEQGTLKEMAVNLHSQLEQRIAQVIPVTRTPGEGVLRLRLAITGVLLEDASLRPRDLLPIKAVLNVLEASSGNWNKDVMVRIEGEVSDSVTNEVFILGIRTEQADEIDNSRETVTYDDLRDVVDKVGSALARGLARGAYSSN